MKKVVPLGVVYGERMDVPIGPEREQFLKEHHDPDKYAFFTDKNLEDFGFKMGYERERRLPDYNSSDHNSSGVIEHWFGDTRLSDTDSLYYKEIKNIRKELDERYKLITNTDEHTTGRQIFYDARKRLLGTFKSATQWAGSVINYTFENYDGIDSYADNEEKLYYEDDSDVAGAVPGAGSVSGGRRKRKTNRKKNKNRRAKSRRQRRS